MSFERIKKNFGFGCMRLKMNGEVVDYEEFSRMIDTFMEAGFNYFDTAHGYIGGLSEKAIRDCLVPRYPRESYVLANKLSPWYYEVEEDILPLFESQLTLTGVDYFDFYLFHCITDGNIDAYLNPKYGVYNYLMEQKKKGRIRHLGFSTHSSLDTIRRFLDAYGEGMEFGQIQLNWLDYDFQNAKAKIDLLKEYNSPVWVMEPVRGGSLVKLAPAHEEQLKALRPNATMAEWAFRFLQTIPDVAVTLSGMSNMAQLKENIAIYEEAHPLNVTEWNTILTIADQMIAQQKVPCTACRYCTTHCPMELDIPHLIDLYNGHITEGTPVAISQDKQLPTACVGCRSCEAVCPQNIQISEVMSRMGALL